MDFNKVLFFENMLTPKIITVVYWLLLAAVVIGGIVTMFADSFVRGIIGLILGLLFARIWCELLIVLFKMNDALQALKSK